MLPPHRSHRQKPRLLRRRRLVRFSGVSVGGPMIGQLRAGETERQRRIKPTGRALKAPLRVLSR